MMNLARFRTLSAPIARGLDKALGLSLALVLCCSTAWATPSSPVPDDCVLTGVTFTTYRYGPLETDCTTTQSTETCPDGTVIQKSTMSCISSHEVTWVKSQHRSSPSGASCPSIVTTGSYTEVVSSDDTEQGEVCPGGPGDCCLVVATGWRYEADAIVLTEQTQTTRAIECPDGSAGVETTKTTTTYRDRWLVSWFDTEPIGDCEENEECEDGEVVGPKEKLLISVRVEVTTNCPVENSGGIFVLSKALLPMTSVSGESLYGPRSFTGAGFALVRDSALALR